MDAGIARRVNSTSLTPLTLCLALVALLCFGTAVTIIVPMVWTLPWTGIVFDYPSMQVISVAPDHVNDGLIQVGDVITHIGGSPLQEATPTHLNRKIGETVTFSLLRDASPVEAEIALTSPPQGVWLSRFIHILLGFMFWTIGVAVFVRQPNNELMRVFLITCLSAAAALIPLDLSTVQFTWATQISLAGMLLCGPSFIHLHTIFPTKRAPRWSWLAGVYYMLAMVFVMSYLHWGVYTISLQPWYTVFQAAFNIYLMTALLAGLGLLLTAWHASDGAGQRKIRVVVAGTFLAVTIVVFTIALGILGGTTSTSYEVGIIALIFIPLAYGYALYREDLMSTDLTLYNFFLYSLLALGVFCVYLILVQGMNLLWSDASQTPLSGGIAGVVVALLAMPARGRMEQVVNHVFYNADYSYWHVLTPAIDRLSDLDQDALPEVLTKDIPNALRVGQSSLWLRSSEIEGWRCVGGNMQYFRTAFSLSEEWQQRLMKDQPILVEEASVTAQTWGFETSIRCIVPLIVTQELQGIWFLGERRRDESFSPLDQRLVGTVGRTAALVVKVRALLDALGKRLLESEAAHAEMVAAYRKLTHSRDDERARLARELHDDALQQLIGFDLLVYQLMDIADPTLSPQLEKLHKQVPEIVEKIRRNCKRLRPVALDAGLISGLNSLARDIAEDFDVKVCLEIDERANCLTDEVNHEVYRIVQEALTNVGKHARTDEAFVRIQSNGGIEVIVEDHGRGISAIESDNRYGLVGIRERILALGGQLSIISNPGRGTRIEVTIPEKSCV